MGAVENIEEDDCERDSTVADVNIEEGDNAAEASSSSSSVLLLEDDESWFSQFRYGSNPWMARYMYALMFLVVNMLAWAVRDYGHIALSQIIRPEECRAGKDCLSSDGVLRVSLACFAFYVIMFLSTVGTPKLHEPREQWHSCWWIAKICLWIILIIISFLVPPDVIGVYGEIAHFGAGHAPKLVLAALAFLFSGTCQNIYLFFCRVFLLIQLVSIISFISWINSFFLTGKYADKCRMHVMLFAIISYLMSIVGITMMYIWYAPQLSCLLNIFFITWTLILLQLMTSISIHPKVNAGILAPGLMGLYIVFSCWCAIRSEPPEERCSKEGATIAAKTDWLTVISFVIAVLAIVIATLSTGIDSKCIQFRKTKKKQVHEDDVPYGYGFFHFVFATGAMYFAMLLIGWNSHQSMRKWTIDVGWTSTWVRIVNEWLAVCVYIWIVVAPAVRKSRREAAEPS